MYHNIHLEENKKKGIRMTCQDQATMIMIKISQEMDHLDTKWARPQEVFIKILTQWGLVRMINILRLAQMVQNIL